MKKKRRTGRGGRSPVVLAGAVLAGAVVGATVPGAPTAVEGIVDVVVALFDMAGLPLLVVATVFGLRQTMVLRHPGRRMAMIAAFAASSIVVCAAVGALAGYVSGSGRQLDPTVLAELGGIVQRAGGTASEQRIALTEIPDVSAASTFSAPDNVFAELARGDLPGVMMCVVLLGLAIASYAGTRRGGFDAQLEAAYRGLETLISYLTRLVPLLVFAFTVQIVGLDWGGGVSAMLSFLLVYLAAAIVVCGVAVWLVSLHTPASRAEIYEALKPPVLVCLVSGSPIAPIPATIDALSARLGMQRGIVELMVPAGAVFLRTGAALHFALMTVFVANLYDHALGPTEFALICVTASIAAVATAGMRGAGSLALSAGCAVALQLPLEAALAVFVLVDVLCEGPRNVVSLLSSCAVVALVCRGLPTEQRERRAAPPAAPRAPLRIVLTRRTAALVVAFGCLTLALTVLVGMGVGARDAANRQAQAPRHLQGVVQ